MRENNTSGMVAVLGSRRLYKVSQPKSYLYNLAIRNRADTEIQKTVPEAEGSKYAHKGGQSRSSEYGKYLLKV